MANIDEKLIAQIVAEVLEGMPQGSAPSGSPSPAPSAAPAVSGQKVTADDYPLYSKHPEYIKTNTGKSLDDITLQNIADGNIKAEDVRISPQTLAMQSQIAESMGRPQLAENFRRAQELIAVPDARILEMYNALRPNRSTKQELLSIADELENQYKAVITAGLVREAAEVYERRNKLRKD